MFPPWDNRFGQRTVSSLLYFLIYAYLNISACRKFSLSLSITSVQELEVSLTFLLSYAMAVSSLSASSEELCHKNIHNQKRFFTILGSIQTLSKSCERHLHSCSLMPWHQSEACRLWSLLSSIYILDYTKESPSSSHHRRESLSSSSQGYKSSKSESKPIRDGAIKGINRSRFFVRFGSAIWAFEPMYNFKHRSILHIYVFFLKVS